MQFVETNFRGDQVIQSFTRNCGNKLFKSCDEYNVLNKISNVLFTLELCEYSEIYKISNALFTQPCLIVSWI